eukprot:4998181-Amphidinium_carterae.1
MLLLASDWELIWRRTRVDQDQIMPSGFFPCACEETQRVLICHLGARGCLRSLPEVQTQWPGNGK